MEPGNRNSRISISASSASAGGKGVVSGDNCRDLVVLEIVETLQLRILIGGQAEDRSKRSKVGRVERRLCDWAPQSAVKDLQHKAVRCVVRVRLHCPRRLFGYGSEQRLQRLGRERAHVGLA